MKNIMIYDWFLWNFDKTESQGIKVYKILDCDPDFYYRVTEHSHRNQLLFQTYFNFINSKSGRTEEKVNLKQKSNMTWMLNFVLAKNPKQNQACEI